MRMRGTFPVATPLCRRMLSTSTSRAEERKRALVEQDDVMQT